MRAFRLISITAIITASVCFAFSQSDYWKWTWKNRNILIINSEDGSKLQLGLRHDGVVIWREIKNGTNNSPSETGRFHYLTPREMR